MASIKHESESYYADFVRVELPGRDQTVLVFDDGGAGSLTLAQEIAALDRPAASELVWHYGPTETDGDPGKIWHTGCGQEVLSIDGGYICGCGQQDPSQEGETMPTAVPPPPEEPRIAGVWVDPACNSVFVKHANGMTVQIKCAEAGLLAEQADGEIHGWLQLWPSGARNDAQLQGLAADQIAKHSSDRYPTTHEQILKLVSEVGELADAWLKDGSANDAFYAELCDVALCVATLANKTGLDLVGAVRQLVETDSRKFT